MSMVEKVAKGLFARAVEVDFKGILTASWGGLAPEVKDFWRALARAAIEAMREPGPVLMKAGATRSAMKGPPEFQKLNAGAVWKAMLNAALSEGER